MDAGAFDRLELPIGTVVTAEHVNLLDRAISRGNRLPGVRVRRHIWPWGTSHSYHGGSGGGGASAPAFEPEVSILDQDSAEVRWTGPRALINGVAPTIGDAEIFDVNPETGERPALRVSRGDFSASGECGIYFRCDVESSDFGIVKITPVALPPPPPTEKLVAHKLALFLRLRAGAVSYNEEDDRELFSSLGFFAVQRRATGVFSPLFWMV